MIETELGSSWNALLLAVVSAFAILAAVIGYTRLAGLRSFSKMSSFDFAVTVAIGSLMATVSLSGSSLADGVVALGTLYVAQVAVALLRRRHSFERIVDNQPVLLVAGTEYLEENLRRTRITEDDIRAKLREANVYDYGSLRAVVLETTGDISVIHGDGPLDVGIFRGVRDAGALSGE